MIKVLIVEDDPMVTEFNRRYLEQIEGFALQATASSVDQALAILEEQPIDLILLDIYMPGKSGLELLPHIRKAGEGTDVIVISAASDIQSVKKALQYGAVDYLIKPFEFERFREALLSYQKEAQLMKEQETLSQKELDRFIFHKEQHGITAEAIPKASLPKGLTRNTLKMIWEHILERKEEPFSTEELANQAGISRVSIRKYLNFLSDIGLLETEMVYGSVGRPVYKHRFVSANKEIIKHYM